MAKWGGGALPGTHYSFSQRNLGTHSPLGIPPSPGPAWGVLQPFELCPCFLRNTLNLANQQDDQIFDLTFCYIDKMWGESAVLNVWVSLRLPSRENESFQKHASLRNLLDKLFPCAFIHCIPGWLSFLSVGSHCPVSQSTWLSMAHYCHPSTDLLNFVLLLIESMTLLSGFWWVST